jgi:acetate kinase
VKIGADALIFTGGIGENRPEIRAQICAGLDSLGISLNEQANTVAKGPESRIGNGLVETWVIEANEELMIARDTAAILSGRAAV